MFERAVREKSRWATPKGLATVEDLWDLPLSALNQIAKDLNKKVKEIGEEDFLADNSAEDSKLKYEFDVVIHILNTKKKEKEDRESMVAKKAEKAKLLEILNRKQEDLLHNLSEEELRKRISEL